MLFASKLGMENKCFHVRFLDVRDVDDSVVNQQTFEVI